LIILPKYIEKPLEYPTYDEIVSAAYAGKSIKSLADEHGINYRRLIEYVRKVFPAYTPIRRHALIYNRRMTRWRRLLRDLYADETGLKIKSIPGPLRVFIIRNLPMYVWMGNRIEEKNRRRVAMRVRPVAGWDYALIRGYLESIDGKPILSAGGGRMGQYVNEVRALGFTSKNVYGLLAGLELTPTERRIAHELIERYVERGKSNAPSWLQKKLKNKWEKLGRKVRKQKVSNGGTDE